MSEAKAPVQEASEPGRRRALLLLFSAVLILAGAGWWVYWEAYARFYESTDNAYVNGNVVQITPQVAGTVLAVNVEDTQQVKAGQVLVQLDPSDAQVAVQQAEADLAQTLRQTRTLYNNNDQYSATVASRQTDLAKAQDDLQRRQVAGGAVSSEELDHAREAVHSAQAALDVARAQLAGNRSLTGQGAVSDHPNVAQANARLHSAHLNLERMTIIAPVDGYVAQRAVQIGQRVAPGTSLMAVVPLNQVWVDANFTEKRLEHVHIGQPVLLSSDFYGDSVRYHGNVAGFSPGTGGAFALLPAQNATGNWIKVVQRLPVRIALDPKELVEHPLRIGLSMQATIDLKDQAGAGLSGPVPPQPAADAPAKPPQKADAAPAAPAAAVKPAQLKEPQAAAGHAAPIQSGNAAAPGAQQRNAAMGSRYLVQVCAYKTREEAEAGRAHLSQLGLESSIEQATLKSNTTWYRLRLGPQASVAEAREVLHRLAAKGYRGMLVKAIAG